MSEIPVYLSSKEIAEQIRAAYIAQSKKRKAYRAFRIGRLTITLVWRRRKFA